MSDSRSESHDPSPLEAASARLEAALERLDRTVTARLAAAAAQSADQGAGQGEAQTGSGATLSAAIAERDLKAALEDGRAENERLQALTAAVSQRLDGTITRLRRVLEG